MNTHCRYCKESFKDLNVQMTARRVQCGRPDCKRAHNTDLIRNKRQKDRANDQPTATGGQRTWGRFTIPDDQSRLKAPEMVYCPNCGLACPTPNDQRLECLACGAGWTLSWGYGTDNVVVNVRLDRWR